MAERTVLWHCHKHFRDCVNTCPDCVAERLAWATRKSLDDCTGEEWNAASKAVGWGSPHLGAIGTAPQPTPMPRADKPASWDLVLADMKERDDFGKSKYGTSLQPGNGRDALADAYQEALDLAVYLRTAIYERDGK